MAGAPIGNKNASKFKLWEDSIRRAVLADDGKRLRAIAEALLDKAADGDVAAIRELGDRLDGKPKQAVEMSGELNVGLAHVLGSLNKRTRDDPPVA